MIRDRIRMAAAAVAVLLLFSTAVFLQGVTADLRDEIVSTEDIYYLPAAGWMKFFSLGYNEVAADMLWSTTLVYFGGKKTWKTKGAKKPENGSGETSAAMHTVRYLELVSRLDPRFRGVYRDGGRLTLYHTGEITGESVKTAISLLEKGRENFPGDGDITFTLGFMHYYEMTPFLPKDPDSPERVYHRDEGVRLMRIASTLEDAPPYTTILSTSLMKREDGAKEMVAEHLRAMLLQETKPSIRRTLMAQLREVAGELADRDIRMINGLRGRWMLEMPNAPFDLFLLTIPSIPTGYDALLSPADQEPSISETDADAEL